MILRRETNINLKLKLFDSFLRMRSSLDNLENLITCCISSIASAISGNLLILDPELQFIKMFMC